MKLYKNVDICDIESILENGILSLNESGNNNWEIGKRANNATDVVYLFAPRGEVNSFPKSYGIALVEVETDEKEVSEKTLADNDKHKNDYDEYTAQKVSSEKITRILIPSIFKSRIDLSESTMKKIEWCGMSADEYAGFIPEKGKLFGGKPVYKAFSEIALEKFANTTKLNSFDYNFFRGINEKNEVFDLYNIRYIF